MFQLSLEKDGERKTCCCWGSDVKPKLHLICEWNNMKESKNSIFVRHGGQNNTLQVQSNQPRVTQCPAFTRLYLVLCCLFPQKQSLRKIFRSSETIQTTRLTRTTMFGLAKWFWRRQNQRPAGSDMSPEEVVETKNRAKRKRILDLECDRAHWLVLYLNFYILCYFILPHHYSLEAKSGKMCRAIFNFFFNFSCNWLKNRLLYLIINLYGKVCT